MNPMARSAILRLHSGAVTAQNVRPWWMSEALCEGKSCPATAISSARPHPLGWQTHCTSPAEPDKALEQLAPCPCAERGHEGDEPLAGLHELGEEVGEGRGCARRVRSVCRDAGRGRAGAPVDTCIS